MPLTQEPSTLNRIALTPLPSPFIMKAVIGPPQPPRAPYPGPSCPTPPILSNLDPFLVLAQPAQMACTRDQPEGAIDTTTNETTTHATLPLTKLAQMLTTEVIVDPAQTPRETVPSVGTETDAAWKSDEDLANHDAPSVSREADGDRVTSKTDF